MPKLRYFLLALWLLFPACGYRLINRAPFTACPSFYVAAVSDEGAESGLALALREALAEELTKRGLIVAAKASANSCRLIAAVKELKTSLGGTSYGDEDVNSYIENFRGECQILAADGQRQFTSGPISGEEIFLATRDLGSSQLDILAAESSRRRLIAILARNMAAECLERGEEEWLSSK